MNGFSRRRLLGGAAACAAALSLPAWGGRRPDTRADFRTGLCATSFADGVFKDGVVYEDGLTKAANMLELQRLMMARGGNELFARLGSSRTPGPRSSEASMVAAQRRARLARSVDVAFNPEFLLCAHYGDMAGQPEPDLSGYPGIALSRPWHELGIKEMCDALRVYGKIVAREILDTGVKVNVCDIGNEIEFGIAGVAIPPMAAGIGGPGWKYKAPDAVDPEIGKMTLGRFFMMPSREQVAWGQAHLWNYTGRILAAVAEGIREVDRHARFATHASAIAALMPEVFVGFYQSLDAMGFRTEQLGVSYLSDQHQDNSRSSQPLQEDRGPRNGAAAASTVHRRIRLCGGTGHLQRLELGQSCRQLSLYPGWPGLLPARSGRMGRARKTARRHQALGAGLCRERLARHGDVRGAAGKAGSGPAGARRNSRGIGPGGAVRARLIRMTASPRKRWRRQEPPEADFQPG